MALGTNAIFQGEWALMRTKLLVGALLVAATAIWAGLNIAAFAASPSGAAVAVVPSAAAEGIAGLRTLVVKGPVYSGDRVKTGPAGLAQILFNDKTRLVVGRNASLLIDKFVYDPNSSAQKFTISATRGAFRFITGKAAKDAYTIRTPTATLGVRGTEFDFSIGPGGETRLALLEGSVRLCNRSGRCITVSGACSVVVVAPNGRIERPASAARSSLLKAAFPFVGGQAGLRADFRVNVSACGLRAPSAPKTRKASLTPGEPTKIAAPQKTRSAGGKSGGGNSGGVAGGGGASGGDGTKGGTGGGGSGGSSGGGSVVAGGGGSGGGGSSGGGSGPVVGAGGGGGSCGGNCGVGKGGGGGNGTGNEGGGAGPGNSGGNGGGKGGGNGGGNSGGNGGGKGGR